MKETADERNWLKRIATERLGIETRLHRVFQSEVEAMGMENLITSLPLDNRYQVNLQDPDGRIIFMYGVLGYGTSPYGGPA